MSIPNWISKNHEKLWNEPWTVDPTPSKNKAFKKSLWDHGYLSPHFTRASAKSGDGVALPDQYRINAQRHAFKLEHVRHANGDGPLSPIDWYRSPAHNAAVGGVSNSEHLYGDATDWNASGALAQHLRDVFAQGGIGSGAVSGNVQHVDDGDVDGGPRRWTYEGR